MPASESLMKALLGKLNQSVTGGDEHAPPAPNEFVAWLSPGLPFDPADLDFGRYGLAVQATARPGADGSNAAASGAGGAGGDQARRMIGQAAEFATLVDYVPQVHGVYAQTGERLSAVYSNVLQFSQVASGELTEAEKAKVEKFRNLLRTTRETKDIITDEPKTVTTDGPVLQAYNEKYAAYLDALFEYNAKRLAAVNSESALAVQDWAINGSAYRQKVKVAADAWASGGYRNEVDQMNAYIDQVTQRDLTLLKRELEDQFERSKLTAASSGEEFYYTSFIPSGFAQASAGWTGIEFYESSYSSYEHSEHTAWSARGSAGFGLFGASVSAGGSSSSRELQIDTSNFAASFEIAQVILSRPWFSPEFLRNTAWKFKDGQGMAPLSDGGRPPSGRLPAYATAAIFVRNVKMNFKELHHADSELTESISAGGGASYGPFSLSGSYEHGESTRTVDSKITGEGLMIGGLQLIGFRCRVLEKSPNPSPDVTAWS